MEIVSLGDVLKEMEAGQPCTITFVTADRQRQRGGEMLTYENCVQTSANIKHGIRNVKLPNGKTRPVHIRLIKFFNGKTVIY